MARNEPITVGPTWTQLTAGDVSAITFENIRENDLFVMATVGAVAPTAPDGLRYQANWGEQNTSLSTLFPGVTSATRVYGRSDNGTVVFVSHA